MRRFLEFQEGSFTEPALRDEEMVDFRQGSVEIAFSDRQKVGTGELIVTSKRILWIGKDDSVGKVYDFDVPFIILHAISRDPDSYPLPCIYCQLDVNVSDNDDDDAGDEQNDSEVYFIPPDGDQLGAMFDALSKAALQNPDLDMEEEEENDKDERSSKNGYGGITETSTGFFCNTDEIQPGSKAEEVLRHLDSVFTEPNPL